jgi:aspartate racemase
MGPEATAVFYQHLVRECQVQFGATRDSDYPRILIDSLPVPDILDGIECPHVVLELLIDAAKRLFAAGVDCLAMPCCTIHVFADQVQSAVGIPLIDIRDAVTQHVLAQGFTTVGILATATTLRSRLFHDWLMPASVAVVTDYRQEAVNQVIHNILAGTTTPHDRTHLLQIAARLAGVGAEAVILGCTELPLLLGECPQPPVPLIDSLRLLAQHTVHYAFSSVSTNPPSACVHVH